MQLGKEIKKESIMSIWVTDFYCQAKIGFCNTGLQGGVMDGLRGSTAWSNNKG